MLLDEQICLPVKLCVNVSVTLATKKLNYFMAKAMQFLR